MRRALLALCLLALPAHAGPPGGAVTVERVEPDTVPFQGPRFAPVTVELYCSASQSQCPFVEAEVEALLARHPQQVRIRYRQLPRGFRNGDLIAEAALEAWQQGRFFEFRETLYDATGMSGPFRRRRYNLDRDELMHIALEAGLDAEALTAALGERRHQHAVERDRILALQLEITGEPAVVFNGRVYKDLHGPHMSPEFFEHAFEEALGRAETLLDEGVSPRRVYTLLLRDEMTRRLETSLRSQRDPFGRRRSAEEEPPRVKISQDGAPARGAASADITVVYFGGFPCAGCRRVDDVLSGLDAAYPGRLRIVFKHLPSKHPDADLAARMAACAQRQGMFWEAYDRLQGHSGRLHLTALLSIAQDIGMDVDRLIRDLEQGRCDTRVDADRADAQELELTKPPALFINGRRLLGSPSFSSLRRLIEEELRPGLLERIAPPER